MGTGGGNVPLVLDEPTITAFGICSQSSNSMKSGNPHSGIYEAETARTLDTSVPDPNKNAGGMAVVSLEGNGSRPSHRGSGIGADISFTLNTIERHGVAYGIDWVDIDNVHPFNQGENAQYKPQINIEQSATLVAKGPNAVAHQNDMRYIVRRLTPQECALLQGFRADYCADLGNPDPTEDDVDFWQGVWETHRKAEGKSTKPKSRKQIINWIKKPHSDSAEYKLWGNGIALPCCVFVLSGIAMESG
jgi:DNA (cytosine-5)-methyltransferase 1